MLWNLVGKMLKEQIEAGILGDDIHHHAWCLPRLRQMPE
jgi:hypothetical protein